MERSIGAAAGTAAVRCVEPSTTRINLLADSPPLSLVVVAPA
jgi:hypothetical protein